MAVALRVIFVLTALLGAALGQVDPDEIVECFIDQNCQDDATPLEVTRRECCVVNPAGAAFRLEGEEACNVCVVFGFFQSTFTALEQGQGYSLPVGYLKRPRPNNAVALPFTVSQEFLGTTTMADFTLQTVLVAVLPTQDSRDVTFTFQVDGIAQEFNETVRLQLSVSQNVLDRLPGDLDNSVYFLDTADLVILDSDSLEIQFTEEDYRSGEAELMLPVRVNKNQRIATPVTVRVTPSTLTQHRLTGRPDPPGTLIDDPDSPIEADLNDFNNTAIEVTFQPDETGIQMDDVDTPIGIINDVINEATEQNLVVTVEIVTAFDTSRITIVREDSLGRIIDDDAIFIGFQRPSYNFNEPALAGDEEDIVDVVLLEKENGVMTEQTFSILVTVTPTTPNQAIGAAELSTDLANNDYSNGAPDNFLILIMDPEDQTIAFNFRLFGDDIAEGTEAFQATSTRVEDTPEYLPPMVLSPSTFIIIEDDDMITIGFETNYTVTESVGSQEICAVVTFPPSTVPILTDITLSVNTIPGTADEMDYDRIAESDLAVFLSFSDMIRRACFNLEIIDDDELEDTESLTIDLVFSSFFPAPSSVILDPNVTTVTILDNDEVVIGFIDPPYEANENDGAVNLTVGVLNGTLQREVVLSLSTADGSALAGSDYQQISGMLLTFGPGVTEINVPVTLINDDVFEIRESFSGNLTLEDGPADRVTVDPAQADVFILDDDELVFGFDPEMYSVSEDIGDAILNISFVSGDVGVFVAQVFASSLNGTAIGGSAGASDIDFISFEDKFATFSSFTSRTDTISVSIVNDDITEQDEQFSAILDNVVLFFEGDEVLLTDQDRSRIILNPSLADVTIMDEDEVVIGFLETEYQVGEADGNVTFLIGVRSGELSFDVDVTFQTADDTAIDGDDYSSRTETLVFTGTETQQVSVNIINDDILEATERFFGELSGILPPRVRLDPVLASVTITDDDPVVIGFVPDSYTVDEGDGEVIFNVSVISGTLDREVVVVFSTQDGTAQAPSDYSNTTQLLAFSSSVTSILVSVPIEDDDVLENIENFSGRLDYSNPDDQSQVTLSPDTATVDIIDNDRVRIGFNPEIYNVFEENDRFVDITVEVLEGELARDVSVQFDTADDSAFSGLDYMAVLGRVLIFNADTTSQVVRVGIVDDNAVEPREYFNGTLTLLSTNATGVTVDPDMARISIEDNDTAIVGFVQEVYDVPESAGTVNVTVRLTGNIAKSVTVVLNTGDGTAISVDEADFTAVNNLELMFVPGGQTEFIIPITIINDNFVEYDRENFTSRLTLSSVSDAIIVMPAEAAINIIDDDMVVIGFEPNTYSASENDPSPPAIVVRVLGGELRRNVIVTFTTEDGSATAGVDYVAIADRTFTFNQDNTEFSIPVTLIDDNIHELDENFRAILGTSDEDVELEPGNAVYTIVNDDDVQFTFRQPMYLFIENGGTGTVCIDKIGETDQTVTLMVSGPLQAETGMNIDQPVTFAPNETSQCIDFDIIDDIIALEDTETFVWSLDILTPSPGVQLGEFNTTTIGILDDDELIVTLEKSPNLPENISVAEACITFSNPFARSFAIEPGTSSMNMSADFSIATPFEDYIPPDFGFVADMDASDAGRICYDAATIVDDLLVEDQLQCFIVNFSIPDDIPMLIVQNSSTICCIEDNDVVTIGFVPDEYSVAESTGEVTLIVQIVDGQLERSVQVDFTTSDGTATSIAPVDFIDPGIVTLQFSNSTTSQPIRIIIENDDILENDENFFGNLATLDGSVSLDPEQAEVTILEDNDEPTIGFDPDSYTVNEDDGSATLTVRLISGTLEREVTVFFETTPGTADSNQDYTRTTEVLNFSPGVSLVDVIVPILQDDIVEADETFFGTLDGQGQPVFVAPDVATVTIQDDNDTVTIGFERTVYPVDEGDIVEVCVVIVSGTLEREAVVVARSIDGSAEAGEDYDAISDLELTFSGDVDRNCFNVSTTGDDVLEIDEEFTLDLDTDDENVILDPEQATVQIIDNDGIEVGLEETEYTTPEGDVVVEVCAVIISGTLQREAVVTLQTADITAEAGADYVALASDLTFSADQNRVCRNVSILDDVIYENNETIRVFLETDDDDVTIVPDRTNGTIIINDNDGIVIGFDQTTYETNETSPTLEVCAELFEGILGRDVVVTASTDNGTAQAPDDYTATIAPLTFNSGEPIGTLKCFNIPIINDAIFEGPENFIGNLVTDEPRVELNPDRTLINIFDDDGLTIGFINPPYSGIEGDGIATLTVAVTSGEIMPGLSVVVNLLTSDLPISPGVFPAVGDVDYVPITDLQLTFTSDITQITINASLVDDSIVEYDELFQASLTFATAETNAAFSDDQENVLIIDDDRITIGLDETFIQVSEDIGVREVCASITEGETQREIVVTLTSEDESAEAGLDFEGVDVDLVFDQFTDQVCTNLIIFSDDLYEGSERFNLSLTTNETFVDLSPDSSVVEIIDQDNIVVGWVQELYEVPESAGVAELCANISQGTLAIDLPGILASFPPGSASSGDDYFELADFQFLFEAGGPTTLCVNISIIDDDLVEIPEDFFGELAFIEVPDNVLIDPGLTTVIINDNDTAVIGFLETQYSINEDDSPAVLSVGIIEGTLAVDIVVGLTTGDDTAIAGEDYDSLTTNLTFIGGPGTEQNPSVVIINDDIDEPDIESFIASLTRLTDLDRVTISPDLANVDIIDDDVVRITIEEPEYTVRENSSDLVELCVIVVEPPDLGRTVVININSMDNTAIAPEDYAPVSSQLTFNATTLRQCVTVSGEEDDVVDPDEDFTVVISNGDDVEFIRNMTTVIIEEGQTITVRFGEPSYTFTESGVTGSIEVIKSGVSGVPFQVRVVGGPSDQIDIVRSADGVDDLVTFGAGPSASNVQVVEFTLTDDDIGLEAVEMYTASLLYPNNEPIPFVVIVQPNTTVINVLDDDEVIVGFGTPSVTVQEDDGTFRMCVVKNRPTISDVTVTIRSDDVTATADQDYSPASIPVTVTVESDSNRTCFNGDIIDDMIALEPTESFTLTITNIDDNRVTPGIEVTEIFIEDTDVVNVRFVQDKYTFNEDGGTATVCIIKDLETASSFSALTVTRDGSAMDPADYLGGSEAITFGTAAGDTQCRDITIIDDSIREETEDFFVSFLPFTSSRINVGDPDESTVCIEDTGITVNDTVIGDPLFTVPILVPESDLQALNTTSLSLCYEIHGGDDTYFNLVTDECASVNAHYFSATSSLNFIDEIGVRAVDNDGNCKNILVSLADNCSVNVDGNTLTSGRYSADGIMIRKYPNRVRISVPNCNELTLVMWVFCEIRDVEDPYSETGQYSGEMLEFMVMRGLNFGHRHAHGLLGQFWNVPVRVSKFTGVDRNGVAVPPESRRYVLNYTLAVSGEPRTYTGWLYELTWSFEEGPCLYVGNRQGGPIYEVTDPNDEVVEGGYKSYRVPSAFSEEEYGFGLFNEERCAISSTPSELPV